MLREEAWRRKLEAAGFTVYATQEATPPARRALRHDPGSCANMVPDPPDDRCPGCGQEACACGHLP
jgi:hypothetical protein